MEESNLRSAKCPFQTARASNVNTNSSSSSSTTRHPFSRLPKLLDSEKDLLSANNGCFKCRRFNTDCKADANNCPGFPSGTGYTTTITNDANAAGKPGKKTFITNSKGKVVTATMTTEESDEDEV